MYRSRRAPPWHGRLFRTPVILLSVLHATPFIVCPAFALRGKDVKMADTMGASDRIFKCEHAREGERKRVGESIIVTWSNWHA